MQQSLYIFNPENDLALAYGVEGYTAPPLAQQLRRDLQMLPVWYCADGATVLSQNCDTDTLWLARMKNILGIEARCIDGNHLQNHEFNYRPWGWNLDLRQRLLNDCVPVDQLPERDSVVRLRELSHRREAVKLNRYLRERVDAEFPPLATEVTSVADIQEFERHNPQCYIKAPWSGSGRGVYRVLEPESRNFTTWAQGIVNRQGSIMCERALPGVMDFALEYRCSGGEVEFAGYSVFKNDSHSSFDSGVVASRTVLRQMIIDCLGDSELLDAVNVAIIEYLKVTIAPHYDGCLGIDMMLYDDAGVVRLNPCVEINLRMTMGVVTAIIGDRYIDDGAVGEFRVGYMKSGGVADFVARREQENPVEVRAGRIVKGFVTLVPVYETSRYIAYIDI